MALATSLARMKAVREAGLDMIHAAVPLFFSSMSTPCMAMIAPMAPKNPLATAKIVMASARICSGVTEDGQQLPPLRT